MKISKNVIYILFVLGVFLGAMACTDHFNALNSPKNALSEDNVDGTLLGQAFAQAQYMGLYGGAPAEFQRSQSLFSDEFAQYFTTTEANFSSAQFIEVKGWINRAYVGLYSKAAPQQKFVEDFTAENNLVVENAIAKVWNVAMYHRWSDFFGPIIYTHFGNAETYVPFDSQEDVYMAFFDLLDEAVEVLVSNPGVIAFGEHDQIYAGNSDQWRKFANSLRLRLGMRLSYVAPDIAREQAERAITDGVIEVNSDNAELITTPNSLNGYSSITYIDEFRMTANWESLLLGYNDPRISEYFAPAQDGSGYSGIRPGLERTEKGTFLNSENSFINIKWRPLEIGGVNMPEKLLRASEVYFLRAEGALRGWVMGGSAEGLYNEGIRASMEEYTSATSAEIEDYITGTDLPIAPNDKYSSPPVAEIPVLFQNLENNEVQLEQIITQKWIALFPNSWEAWAERRRTGYPKGYAIMGSMNTDIARDELFRRMTFTNTERSNNFRAVQEAESFLSGPDANYTRLWWDAKSLDDFPTPVD